MKWPGNLGVVYYTNEKSNPILAITLQQFYKHNPTVPVYVIINRLTGNEPVYEHVTYLNADVSLEHDGREFSEIMQKVLPQIKEEHILWFLDDYWLTHPIDVDPLARLLQLLRDDSVDLFTFGSFPAFPQYEKHDTEYDAYGFPEEQFYYIPLDHPHLFTIQPGIWNKASLLRIVTENHITLHNLDYSFYGDNAFIKNPESYKVLCTRYRIFEEGLYCDYWIIGYIEVTRHGAFYLCWNGFGIDPGALYHKRMLNIILENKLHLKPEYDKWLYHAKPTIVYLAYLSEGVDFSTKAV